jgi:hypothetical protein
MAEQTNQERSGAGVSLTSETKLSVKGRWVGKDLWWDIGEESISDADLRKWVWNNLRSRSLSDDKETVL